MLAGPTPQATQPSPASMGAMPPASALPVPVQAGRWDRRADGSQKGDGFFGALARPDGGVSSEISISTDDFGGADFPSIVPSLTPEELKYLLNMRMGQDPMPESIVRKALDFAYERQKGGQPFFAGRGEQNDYSYPQMQRVPVIRK